MGRRAFLHRTAGGVLLSVLAVRTASGATAEDVTLVSDGLALTVLITAGQGVQLRALTNARTGFEWCQAGAPLEPVLVAVGGARTGWVMPAAARRPAKTRLEFAARHAASAVTAEYALQSIADAPVVEVQGTLQHDRSSTLGGVTAFGAVRFRLRDDLKEVRLHQESGGLSVLEAVGTDEFLILASNGEGAPAVSRRRRTAHGSTWTSAGRRTCRALLPVT